MSDIQNGLDKGGVDALREAAGEEAVERARALVANGTCETLFVACLMVALQIRRERAMAKGFIQ